MTTTLRKSPQKITVKSVESRYGAPGRPAVWDTREPGVDIVTTTDGRVLKLKSDGQQSSPSPGWVLMVDEADAHGFFSWTLYGIPPQS